MTTNNTTTERVIEALVSLYEREAAADPGEVRTPGDVARGVESWARGVIVERGLDEAARLFSRRGAADRAAVAAALGYDPLASESFAAEPRAFAGIICRFGRLVVVATRWGASYVPVAVILDGEVSEESTVFGRRPDATVWWSVRARGGRVWWSRADAEQGARPGDGMLSDEQCELARQLTGDASYMARGQMTPDAARLATLLTAAD